MREIASVFPFPPVPSPCDRGSGPLGRDPQSLSLVDDRHLLQHVTLPDGVDDVLPFDHAAEDGVFPVEMRRGDVGEPLVLGPELAIDNTPGLSCRRSA